MGGGSDGSNFASMMVSSKHTFTKGVVAANSFTATYVNGKLQARVEDPNGTISITVDGVTTKYSPTGTFKNYYKNAAGEIELFELCSSEYTGVDAMIAAIGNANPYYVPGLTTGGDKKKKKV